MSSTPTEILNVKLREEFRMTYSENDLWQMYLKEYEIIFNTDNYLGATKDEDFENFKEHIFETFKEERLE